MQWDTSKVWSYQCQGPSDRIIYAFDGDLLLDPTVKEMMRFYWNPPGGIAFQTMRVYGRAEAGNPQGIKYTLEGQAEVSLDVPDTGTWLTLFQVNWTLRSWNVGLAPGNSGVTSFVGGIEADGKLFVDGTPCLGTPSLIGVST